MQKYHFKIRGIVMKLSKKSIIRFAQLPLLAVTILAGILSIKGPEMHLRLEFDKLIRQDDLSLTIYYLSPFVLLRHPLSDTQLMNGAYEHKVTISSSKLKEHTDLLNQINKATLKPVVFKSYQDTRLIYVFETMKGDRILSVSMQAGYGYMYVNRREVKVDKLFYEVVMPFLPDDAVKEIQRFLEKQAS